MSTPGQRLHRCTTFPLTKLLGCHALFPSVLIALILCDAWLYRVASVRATDVDIEQQVVDEQVVVVALRYFHCACCDSRWSQFQWQSVISYQMAL